ncbi:MAG: penicillin-binding protein 1C [Betaproteobacteria bacterium]|nr:penicillin-binding protein 1C [Betaproteobacteria bacterium]
MGGLLLGLFLLTPVHAAPPGFAGIKAAHRPSEAWVLDRHGALLQTVRADPSVRRLPWVRLDELSPAMINALIVSEDKRFLEHGGTDWRAMVSAVWDNLSHGSRRGASTLTMQLAGLLDPELARGAEGRTLAQKWLQIRAAQDLERYWTKQQILEAYFNRVNFRGELAGIRAAALGLFGKHPSGLDKAESSLLAALLRGPNAKPAVVAKRACGVAAQLDAPQPDCRRITSLAWSRLSGTPRLEMGEQLAPHYARRLELKPGQSVRTSLDAGLQRFVLGELRRQLAELAGRQVEDGAAIVLDNRSGEVLAYVGSSDATSAAPEVDGVGARRQAGSTLKPFLYALALESRLLTAASPLEDSPLALDTPSGQYVPQNYERDFKGWVSVRTALGASLNVPAVRTLVLTGTEIFHQRLLDLGLTTLDQDTDFYGYALALGGAEVTLAELTNAYRALANGGVWRGMPLARQGREKASRRVFTPQSAHLIGDILADPAARALTFGLDSPLTTLGWAAVKTGTSKDMRDNWAVGYTPRYTVGVWVGNASGAPMHEVSGVTGAAPVWQAIINRLHGSRPETAPKAPPGLETLPVRFEPAFEPPRSELFLTGTGQTVFSLAQGAATRIHGPGNGAVLALDPDIPPERQKVRFQARPPRVGAVWQVDEQPAQGEWLEPGGDLLWPPRRGAHRIRLLSPEGQELDAVFLTVK